MKHAFRLCGLLTMLLPALAAREIPEPLPDHPGNIFLAGQEVRVCVQPAIPKAAIAWKALDDTGARVAGGSLDPGMKAGASRIAAGKLGVGWYRIECSDAGGECVRWTTAAVLARLKAPTPEDSPVCVDAAISWFARGDLRKQEAYASLAALAGVNWTRDRMRWRDVETAPGKFAKKTDYDTSASFQARHGLKVLQVFHSTPAWAADTKLDGNRAGGRFPRDLRHAYRFCRAMARRFHGLVQAWEPWNEANVPNFGGHTVDEMCAMQKAAYLGFKAGDPGLIVGWNAYAATPEKRHARGVIASVAWPYFDTYNFHTYDWADSYEELWAPALQAACGRPIWITESDRGIQYEKGSPWQDLSLRRERLKAQFMAQSYASSLFAGASRHFHFVLGDYTESPSNVQFGLLRRDLTPRPAYVALAALGRFLAGARSLGRWHPAGNSDAHVHAFRARPDGIERDVLVAWAEKRVDWPSRGAAHAAWSLPEDLTVEAAYDYLGRPLRRGVPERLGSAPCFVLLAVGDAGKLPLERSPNAVTPHARPTPPGAPSPVVLQLQMPRSATRQVKEKKWSYGYEYRVEPGKEITLPVYAYNFGDRPVRGTVRVESSPQGWNVTPGSWEVSLQPLDRVKLTARALVPETAGSAGSVTLILGGDFGPAGRPALAADFIGES